VKTKDWRIRDCVRHFAAALIVSQQLFGAMITAGQLSSIVPTIDLRHADLFTYDPHPTHL
jgi:hypothetical protein